MVDRNTQIRGGQIFDDSIPESKFQIDNAPIDGYFLSYNTSLGKLEYVAGADAVTETPTGLINGVNTSYTVANTPETGSMALFLNGLYQEEGSGNDYLLTGSAIEFNIAPDTGDILVSSYIKGGVSGVTTSDKIEDADGNTKVEVEQSANEDKIRMTTAGTERAVLDSTGLTLEVGTNISEFSIDGTLAGDSDDVVPTEKAVKTAIDAVKTSTIEVVFDGGGSVITVGEQITLELPFAGTITQVSMLADQTGSIVVDIYKDTFANYPPVGADSITSAAKPTISASDKSQDATLTGWTKTFSAGEIMRFNVDSAATIERCTLSLKVTRD